MLTHEEVIRVRVRSTNLEQLHEVMELAVYVTTYSDRTFLEHLISFVVDARGCFMGWQRTTGCTFDSSVNTSLAFTQLQSA